MGSHSAGSLEIRKATTEAEIQQLRQKEISYQATITATLQATQESRHLLIQLDQRKQLAVSCKSILKVSNENE